MTIELHSGAEHELARVHVGIVGAGPTNVVLSADRRIAYPTWSTGEPGCLFELGAVRTDGHGALVTVDRGIGPAISRDGTRLAYYRVPDSSCSSKSLVIIDVRTGSRRNITVGHDLTGIDYGGGPWWRADGRHLVAPIGSSGSTSPRRAYELDTRTATSLADASPIDLTCGATIDMAHKPIGVSTDDRAFLADVSSEAKPITISACDLHTGRRHRLTALAGDPRPFAWSVAGRWLTFSDRNAVVWRWDGQQPSPTRVIAGPVQSLAG